MNINEVEKHVKFDLIFTLLLILGVGLCFLLSIVFIFKPTSVSAKEITNNVTISSKSYMPCNTNATNGKYCAASSENVFNVRNVGTTYSGSLIGLTFQFGDMINVHSQYIMTIEAMSTDFRNSDFDVLVYASSQSDQQGSMIFNYTYSFVSKSKIQIIFTPDSYNYHTVILSGNPLTGINTYGIKKVTLSYDDGINDNSDIINSNAQNTSDIIDNANSNTNDIIDASAQNALNIINNQNQNTETTNNTIWQGVSDIVSTIASRCTNKIDMSKITLDSGVTASSVSAVTGSITINSVNNKGFWTDYMTIEQGTDYYFNYSQVGSGGYIIYAFFYDSNKTQLSSYRIYGGKICQNQSACYPVNAKYLRIHLVNYQDGERSFTGLRVTPSSTVGFCQFGTNSNNKLDGIQGAIQSGLATQHQDNQEIIDLQQEANDIAQEQYDWLSDDTDPSVDNNEISNVLGLVSVNDPLIYLTTLPITLLNKINVALNSNQCNDFTIGSFGAIGGVNFGNYTFKFPCLDIGKYIGNSLWNTIDIIVGIGLLALSIYKFYHMITNILSLGAEEKASKISHYFTPMEFLSLVIEGDVPGITIRKGVVNE